ncbi:GNAT family N-acetyltransferase [Proteiniborus sp. MB09-C3]|uniref:GNAT family N-acetyltransferase n=1 Tax=Proteiniborus sp. MB09-C3 TaxID=3050072 RepID=UPI00255563B0|nr:GNAT family N-acetyltransferase [Proteiniborus sp. MB09-C3]WIV11521.1 GNAT family N-acetyltransferase [Proteiniborus sp. MB09-C3]
MAQKMKREFRKLHLSDLELVLQMENDFRSNFIFEENARQFLSNPINWIFACIQEDQIIGFAYGYELNRLDNKGNMLYIHEVGVLPKFQKQGIGFQILTDIKNLCKLTGICRFFLFTQKHNIAACALYEKAGGEKTSSIQEDDVTYFFNKFN